MIMYMPIDKRSHTVTMSN